MESIDMDYDNSMEHASNRPLTSPSSPDIGNIVGEPQSDPRIGHEYQVEVPSMIKESERLQLLMNPADSELVNDNSHRFALGLPIPLIWVPNDVVPVGVNRHEGWGYLGDNDGKVNVSVPAAAVNAKKNGISDDGKEVTTSQSVTTEGQLSRSKNYLMAPGTLTNSWSDADVKGFLLGLFIFGKNFVQLKRFLENKGMGEILSFYYGKFYKSDEYRRWSDCRKIKGRKCTRGHKIFPGRKQQEVMSRLISHVSEEFQDTLLQVSKSYAEGRTSVEEYISSLKSIVGLGVLVEAVGIGKGKEDLTSLAVEPAKKNQVLSKPTSKGWSSLGPHDIIKFFTGGYQPSEAKSDDIFWKAVWPRLLARGWHSEKLKNQDVRTKNLLVFLIPGVKKFSRKKLVRGDHYFDSVSDVLSKVIAEPNLLELKVKKAKASGCNDEKAEKGSKEDDQPDHHCYLKPQASKNSADHVKCTFINTSLVHGAKSSDLRKLKSLPGNLVGKIEVDAAHTTYNKGKTHISKTKHMKGKLDCINQKLTMLTVVDTGVLYDGKLSKVRELRYPPVELQGTSKKTGIARESARSSLDDISPIETEAAIRYSKKNNNAACHKSKHNRDVISQKEVDVSPDKDAKKIAENHEDQMICVSDGNHLKRTIKHQFSRRARSGQSNLAVPPLKRRRLTACVKAETNRILENSARGLASEKLGLSQSSCFLDANKKAGDPVSHQQDVTLASSDEGRILNRISPDKVAKCESQPSIKFITPDVPIKSEDGEMMEIVEDDIKPNDVTPRRQSTRNRPLTVRALESLANEFLHVQRKQKTRDTLNLQGSFSSCSRARTRVDVGNTGDGDNDRTAKEGEESSGLRIILSSRNRSSGMWNMP
ncbi:hypothetical protein RJT34_22961 [Clitoria ternatea]|uniref:SANT domain-containing protein n=1 Tax=Clitoria ternatea TaxID=43366 RepID=A0AAN9FMQ9_CLITE